MQLALIVDDSKTARTVLAKKLDRLNILVHEVDSAEAALDYLSGHYPDVIFMDHMMPGMDGFAAVKVIKSDSDKASIPIIMHTTKNGHIYRGQARALGAADILTKPASNEELREVLSRVEAAEGDASLATQTNLAATNQNGLKATTQTRLKATTQTGLKAITQTELRAITQTDIDAAAIAEAAAAEAPSAEPAYGGGQYSGSEPGSGEAAASAGVQAAQAAQTTQAIEEPRSRFGRNVLFVLWALLTAWLLVSHFLQQQHIRAGQEQRQQLLSSLNWAVNQRQGYDYGERPLSRERLSYLRGLVDHLRESGFSGRVVIEGHSGAFCLSNIRLRDNATALMLPDPDLPLSACDVIGTSSFEARKQSVAESAAFSRYRQSLDGSDGIRLEIRGVGSATPREAYPQDIEGITTGDWNTAALANNRIEFLLIAD